MANSTTPLHNLTTPRENLDCFDVIRTNGTDYPPLEGDPDIAGVGVVLSFLITAYFTLAIALVGYVFGLIPSNLINVVDRKIFRVKASRSPKWSQALEKGVLTFSDQQIITGIALLVAGFARIQTLSLYHWQLILYLAWMSSVTHLTTLTMLRDHFHLRPFASAWRLSGMYILLLFLIVAFVPTASVAWTNSLQPAYRGGISQLGAPAKCFWKPSFYKNLPEEYTGLDSQSPFSYLILLGAHIWKTASIVHGSKLTRRIREMPLDLLGRRLVTLGRQSQTSTNKYKVAFVKTQYQFGLATYLGLVALIDFFQSFVSSLWALTLLLIWGTLNVTGTRHGGREQIGKSESSWGFGQILPLLLLAIPLATIWEHFFKDKSIKTDKKNDDEKDEEANNGDTTAAQTADAAPCPSSSKPNDRLIISEQVSEMVTARGTRRNPNDDPAKDPEEVLPFTLTEYIAAQHPFSDQPGRLDHEIVSQRYLYQSRFFLSLYVLSNVLLFVGCLLLFAMQGLLVFYSDVDLRQLLWVVVGALVLAALACWGVWIAFGMLFSDLFKCPAKGPRHYSLESRYSD